MYTGIQAAVVSSKYSEHTSFYSVLQYGIWTDRDPLTIKNTYVVSQDRCFLLIGSVTLKCRTFRLVCVVSQDRWSVMAVVSQERRFCIIAANLWTHEDITLQFLLLYMCQWISRVTLKYRRGELEASSVRAFLHYLHLIRGYS